MSTTQNINTNRADNIVTTSKEKELEQQIHYRLLEKLFESERSYKELIEQLREVIFICDSNQHITFINDSWHEHLGYDLKETIGRSIVLFVHPNSKEDYHKLIQSSKNDLNCIHKTELCLMCKDGSNLWFEISLKYGLGHEIKGSLFNITERKKAEESIKQTNKELLLINQSKLEFLSMASHELRTPLSSIKEALSLVIDGVDGPINNEQQSTLTIAKKNVDRLARLINNVLDFTKLDSDAFKLNIKEHDVCEFVQEIYDLMKVDANRQHIDLTLQAPSQKILAKCDKDKLQQIVVNLVHNAIKFTEKGGNIRILLYVNDENVIISVKDTGAGIEKDEQKKIFEMFGQGSYKGMWKTGGTGVGLAVCTKIIEKHKGSIRVESKPGVGSNFTVSFNMNLQE